MSRQPGESKESKRNILYFCSTVEAHTDTHTLRGAKLLPHPANTLALCQSHYISGGADGVKADVQHVREGGQEVREREREEEGILQKMDRQKK